MGRTIVQVVLSNYRDLEMVEEGTLTPDKVRRVVIDGVVDTGAARLVLPLSVVQHLGLPVIGQSVVRYADHRREMRDIVKNAHNCSTAAALSKPSSSRIGRTPCSGRS